MTVDNKCPAIYTFWLQHATAMATACYSIGYSMLPHRLQHATALATLAKRESEVSKSEFVGPASRVFLAMSAGFFVWLAIRTIQAVCLAMRTDTLSVQPWGRARYVCLAFRAGTIVCLALGADTSVCLAWLLVSSHQDLS